MKIAINISLAWLIYGAASLTQAAVSIQVLDSDSRAAANVVVYLSNQGSATAAAPTASQPGVVEIQQKDRQFMPLVTVVQVGTVISFPNNDTVRHHVYSFSPVRSFQIKLYAGKPEAPVLFDKLGTVVIGCNIHDQMLAFVHVVETPFFAKTDATGMASIGRVPPGKYTLKAWHYKQPATLPVTEQAVVVKDDDSVMVVKLGFKAN